MIHHDLGKSYFNRQSVNTTVLNAAPVTASLVFGGALLWMLIALPIGVLSALRPRSLLDRTAMVFVLIGISAHPVWIGLNLRTSSASCSAGRRSAATATSSTPRRVRRAGALGVAHVLPWITFAILFAALYVRMIRASVMEALDEDYVRTARAKGAPERACCAPTSCGTRCCRS